MPNSEPMLSVAEVLEMEPGDDQNAAWINPGFVAEVASIKNTVVKATGKPMDICTLKDTTGSATISMTIFGRAKFGVGAEIEVSGKGLRRTVYKDLDQVSVGKETEIHVTRSGPDKGPANSEPIPGQRMADGTEPTQPVFGATVGMAMNQAIALLTHELTHDEVVQSVCGAHFWKAVHETASDVIRVSRMLEAGKLAPSVKERTAGPAPANPSPSRSPAPTPAPHRGQPQNDEQAANRTGAHADLDSVPF